ncbi:MAG: amidohydrolase [Ruminococcaceae bacterium]|nr:amidohydrolase [Oscillospiraceae bacterium]
MVIKNAYIITMDDQEVIHSGYVVTEGRKITYVGEELPVGIDTTKVIDARGGIVMPGLINAHTHSPMSLLRGYADDLPLHSWLFDKIFPAENKLDSDAVYFGSVLSIAEMIKSGTTAFSDMYFTTENAIKAAMDSGIKANIAPCITGFDSEYIVQLEKAKELFKTYNNEKDGNIKIDYALHSVYSCSTETLRAVAQAAKHDGTGLSVHVSETEKENSDCLNNYGISPVKLLFNTGVLGKATNAAHCVYLSDEDMEILARSETVVATNPTSNLKLASGIAETAKMLENGISLAIGTDGAASNNSLDMFAEMKLCALLAKGTKKDASCFAAYDALEAAISGGALALSRQNETGKIKEGFDADIIILDADSPNLCPVYSPISTVVYSANAGNVETSIIGGEIIMENREFLTIDMEKIKREAKKTIERIGISQ